MRVAVPIFGSSYAEAAEQIHNEESVPKVFKNGVTLTVWLAKELRMTV